MSKVGTFYGAITEVGQDETANGAPYYGLVIDSPEFGEPLEARFYFSTPEAIKWSTERLAHLGIDCKKPPLPQLEKLVGRAVGVKTRLGRFDGRDRVEVTRVWLAAKNEKKGADPILVALGIELEPAEDAWDETEADELIEDPS